MITVTINYKGQIATEVGEDTEELSFQEPLPLIELLQALSAKATHVVSDFIFDAEGSPRRSLLVAVDDEQVIDFQNTLIKDDCVISLLPPIAGG
jgi:molybdopterin converting factor small subunit|tara:strand:+ start:37 stop:318 length:282 start_codon:yes stop_codon:yes gene_type:complete